MSSLWHKMSPAFPQGSGGPPQIPAGGPIPNLFCFNAGNKPPIKAVITPPLSSSPYARVQAVTQEAGVGSGLRLPLSALLLKYQKIKWIQSLPGRLNTVFNARHYGTLIFNTMNSQGNYCCGRGSELSYYHC